MGMCCLVNRWLGARVVSSASLEPRQSTPLTWSFVRSGGPCPVVSVRGTVGTLQHALAAPGPPSAERVVDQIRAVVGSIACLVLAAGNAGRVPNGYHVSRAVPGVRVHDEGGRGCGWGDVVWCTAG